MDEQMQRVLQLMQARACGKVSNDQVETAVASLLNNSNKSDGSSINDRSAAANPTSSATTATDATNSTVELDEDEYDDIPADTTTTTQQNSNKAGEQPLAQPTTNNPQNEIDDEPPPPQPQRKRGRPRKNSKRPPDRHPIDFSVYERIPFGKQGAKMMTTFGDARQPDPAVVEATLLGARKMVQVAMQDARHIRRGNCKTFRNAQKAMRAYRPVKPLLDGNLPAELQFRAVVGYDKLSYDPKCGFDVEELHTLYPEELTNFSRWNYLHHESTKGTKGPETTELDDDPQQQQSGKDSTNNNNNDDSDDDSAPLPLGGHLEERAAQFDTRTDRMVGDWYVKFSDVRTGSFLPRRSNTKGNTEWNSNRKKGRGSHRNGTWAHYPAVSVRFLHWLGFDPQSALPPPSQETTEALGYLAHDFFGRIVEKAILLRCIQQNNDQTTLVLELGEGQKLTPRDIEQAMADPSIKPVPLYSTENGGTGSAVAPQLYFGPGFEKRMELEMEHAMQTTEMQTEVDLGLRKQEEELFSKIAAPPDIDALENLMNENPLNDKPKRQKNATNDNTPDK